MVTKDIWMGQYGVAIAASQGLFRLNIILDEGEQHQRQHYQHLNDDDDPDNDDHANDNNLPARRKAAL